MWAEMEFEIIFFVQILHTKSVFFPNLKKKFEQENEKGPSAFSRLCLHTQQKSQLLLLLDVFEYEKEYNFEPAILGPKKFSSSDVWTFHFTP